MVDFSWVKRLVGLTDSGVGATAGTSSTRHDNAEGRGATVSVTEPSLSNTDLRGPGEREPEARDAGLVQSPATVPEQSAPEASGLELAEPQQELVEAPVYLRAKTETAIKTSTKLASTLPPEDRIYVKADARLCCEVLGGIGGHLQVRIIDLDGAALPDREYFVYGPAWETVECD